MDQGGPALTRVVVDASITAAILFDDEVSERDGPIWNALRESDLEIPAHWSIELVSLLLKAERRNRVTRERRNEHFLAARTLLAPARTEPATMSLLGIAFVIFGVAIHQDPSGGNRVAALGSQPGHIRSGIGGQAARNRGRGPAWRPGRARDRRPGR